MENPYQPSTAPLPSAPAVFQWARILFWAPLIFMVAMMVGFASGLSMSKWQLYGSTMDEAFANARVVRLVAYALVGAFLYWRFAAGISSRRLLHVIALYAFVQVIDVSFALVVFGVSLDQLFDPFATGRSLLAASAGLAIAQIGASGWAKPKQHALPTASE